MKGTRWGEDYQQWRIIICGGNLPIISASCDGDGPKDSRSTIRKEIGWLGWVQGHQSQLKKGIKLLYLNASFS